MAVALSRISMRVPTERDLAAEAVARSRGPAIDQRLLSRVLKLEKSPRLAADDRMIDLILDAGREALGDLRPSMVLYGHTLLLQPFGHRDEFGPMARGRLGLAADVPVYGISRIGCTSVLRAADLARRYLVRPGAAREEAVLILGGDQGTMAGTLRVIPPYAVCGDAAAAFVMRCDAGRYRFLGTAAGRDTRFHRNARMTEDEVRKFGASSTSNVVKVIDAALASAALKRCDVDWIMPHMANAVMWRNVCRALRFDLDKVYLDLLPELGHMFGIDALAALQHADHSGRLVPGQRCLLVAVGQGAFFQATVVEVLPEL
ncbi:3-oxoacyl-[acyl-carrier-protein] synthase III C-terminal domain-containing protein [Micromonospora sp. NPDC050686]|uniref:3-oxoacyl-[acyl-carrier-protein] synthase III C-terminal domain-containing protein n=1 Tax=Micromonospora sp. NPDC050686 TaxID=3154631 RepID=UPI00340854B1